MTDLPQHVMNEGGLLHYQATQAQTLHHAILEADWQTVRQIATDPYTAGDDVDVAKGALAGAGVDLMPPSTVAELRDVLIDYEAARPRSMQKELGPSELGTPCRQQIARKLAGAPRRPVTEPTWAPFQGTAVHASMEQVVAFWNAQLGRERWLAEDRLVVDPGPGHYPPVEGNGDAFDTDHAMVVDWKHVGTTALKNAPVRARPRQQGPRRAARAPGAAGPVVAVRRQRRMDRGVQPGPGDVGRRAVLAGRRSARRARPRGCAGLAQQRGVPLVPVPPTRHHQRPRRLPRTRGGGRQAGRRLAGRSPQLRRRTGAGPMIQPERT
jgi:hypothetical protein